MVSNLDDNFFSCQMNKTDKHKGSSNTKTHQVLFCSLTIG